MKKRLPKGKSFFERIFIKVKLKASGERAPAHSPDKKNINNFINKLVQRLVGHGGHFHQLLVFQGRQVVHAIMDWVYFLTSEDDFVVAVRSCAGACVAHGADALAALDFLAGPHIDALHVAVERFEAEPVVDDHVMAIPRLFVFHRFNDAVAGSLDRRAFGGGEVYACVHFAHFVHGVEAVSETGEKMNVADEFVGADRLDGRDAGHHFLAVLGHGDNGVERFGLHFDLALDLVDFFERRHQDFPCAFVQYNFGVFVVAPDTPIPYVGVDGIHAEHDAVYAGVSFLDIIQDFAHDDKVFRDFGVLVFHLFDFAQQGLLLRGGEELPDEKRDEHCGNHIGAGKSKNLQKVVSERNLDLFIAQRVCVVNEFFFSH